MPEQHPESASLALPDNSNLEWLRKQAKARLAELRQVNPRAKLADAQFELAKRYGFSSWRALKEHLDSLTLDGQIIESARKGHVERLAMLLDEHPEKLHLKVQPYEASLLFPAAQSGNVDAVGLLMPIEQLSTSWSVGVRATTSFRRWRWTLQTRCGGL
jgi:hypothetical protein